MQGFHITMRAGLAAVGAAALATGCIPERPEDETEVGSPNINEGGTDPGDDSDPCPLNGCGGNSPVIAGVYFGAVHLGGTENDEHVQLVGVTAHDGETPLHLGLAGGDRLRAEDPEGMVYEHAALSGVQLHVRVKGEPYVILIRNVQAEAHWAAPPAPDGLSPSPAAALETYELLYHPLGFSHRMRPLCSEHASGQLRVIAFGGDTYHPDTKQISIGPATDGWVNLACEGSAVYKMHMLGYTSAAAEKLGFSTTLAERQALLNAWTANVCGTGRSFTKPGVALSLREVHGVVPADSPYHAPMKAAEAIWTAAGAVCLDTFRTGNTPELLDAIAAECAGATPPRVLPPCEDRVDDWAAHGAVLTGIPSL